MSAIFLCVNVVCASLEERGGSGDKAWGLVLVRVLVNDLLFILEAVCLAISLLLLMRFSSSTIPYLSSKVMHTFKHNFIPCFIPCFCIALAVQKVVDSNPDNTHTDSNVYHCKSLLIKAYARCKSINVLNKKPFDSQYFFCHMLVGDLPDCSARGRCDLTLLQ